jgi:hypothetical protein
MSVSGNFDSPVKMVGALLEVKGSSGAPEGDSELVSRHLALHQDGNIVHGEGNHDLNWAAKPQLSATGFEEGKALAIGSETYFTKSKAELPMFVTVSWSQIVELERT